MSQSPHRRPPSQEQPSYSQDEELFGVLFGDGTEKPGHPAAEINDERKFKELELLVPEDVKVLGFSTTSILQGWGDVVVNNVNADSWALANGMKLGDEILQLNEQNVLDMDERTFVERMKMRPLKILLFVGPTLDKSIEEVVRPKGITNASQLLEACADHKITVLPDYEYIYMSRMVNSEFVIPCKTLPRGVATTKSVLVGSRILSDKSFTDFVNDVEEIMDRLSTCKTAGNAKEFIEVAQSLPEGFWGKADKTLLERLWVWPAGPFDVNARNIDFQINIGLSCPSDPDHDGKTNIRLIRHYYNMPSLTRANLLKLTGTTDAGIDWDAIGDYRAGGHLALQLALTKHIGGITFQSKRLSKSLQRLPATVSADGVDVDTLLDWVKHNGDADPADRSIFTAWWAKEAMKADSNLKTLKAVGISKDDIRNIIMDYQSKGAKGSEEMLAFDLTFDDFDVDRLPWLKAFIEHFKRDRTQGPVLLGPRKCGKSQFLLALCMWASDADKKEKMRLGETGAESLKTGVLVSNDRDNFSRSLRTKRNLAQFLDDPNLAKWLQPDWLAWLDLVARGNSAATRFENVPLVGFRALASNKTMEELFWNKSSGKMSDAEVDAVKNKGKFLDLHDQAKLDQMRRSTWYRDSVSGRPVPIILTEQGERKVRERFGLDCPDVLAEPHQGQPTTPPAEQPRALGQSVTMELSPLTCEALKSALGPASSSPDSIVLGPSACKKLRTALSQFGNHSAASMDSLAHDA